MNNLVANGNLRSNKICMLHTDTNTRDILLYEMPRKFTRIKCGSGSVVWLHTLNETTSAQHYLAFGTFARPTHGTKEEIDFERLHKTYTRITYRHSSTSHKFASQKHSHYRGMARKESRICACVCTMTERRQRRNSLVLPRTP